MQDYFGGDTNGAAANGTAQPAAATNGGDTGMTDEVL
jgi:THO complex subunit 4